MASGMLSLSLPVAKGAAEYLVQDYISRHQVGHEGRFVSEFEQAIADYLQVRHAIGTRSYMASLHLALVALGIGRYASQRQPAKDDAVLVPGFADISVADAVSRRQAVPIFCDIDPETWCITGEEVEATLRDHAERGATSTPRAVICLHVNGYPCDMDGIMEVARRNRLHVIEDASEALGGEYRYPKMVKEGRFQKMGTVGVIGCLSFADDRQVRAGQGGMCITNSDSLAFGMRMYRDYGVRIDETGSYYEVVQFEHRMTDLQAAMGLDQIKGINEEASRRRWLCEILRIALRSPQPLAPAQSPWLFHHSVTTEKGASKLLIELGNNAIESRAFHPPVHLQEPYIDGVARLPVTESLFGILLPLHEGVTAEHIEVVRWLLSETATV